MNIIAKGADISKHNGKIDWTRVKKTEIQFVIIRAGYGMTTTDSEFVNNIEGAIKCGLDIGIYWFSYAKDTAQARQEAGKCLSLLAPYKKYINYPVFFDWEYDSYNYVKKTYGISADKKLVSDMAVAFLDVIKVGGYKPGLYGNKDYAYNFFNDAALGAGDFWIAHVKDGAGNPRDTTDYKGTYTMHQYSWIGRPSGFINNTDMNYCYKDYAGTASTTPASTPAASPTSSPIVQKKYQIPAGITFATDTSKNVISTYKYSKSAAKKLSDHFQVKEFASISGWKVYSDDVKVHNQLIIILEALYKELNCSKIIVTSGYRTPQHDKAVGGDGKGQHTLGRAADIRCYDKNGSIISAKKVCCTLEDMGGIYGIGYISSTAVHVDTRSAANKWWGDETKTGAPNIKKLGYDSWHKYFGM